MIILKNITKEYKMGEVIIRALDNLSIDIREGEFSAIIGPSGSGKSTLMNIIGCLDIPTKGEYILNDIPVSNYSDYQLADIRNRKIGFVFQQFNLLPYLTALENVEIPLTYAGIAKSKRTEKAKNLLDVLGLRDRMYHKPTELSGGQQQRVSIARALANDPSIILADEPTGALDTNTGIEVLEILKQFNSHGKTVVVITHDHEVARFTDRIISIRDGKVESDSKKSEAI